MGFKVNEAAEKKKVLALTGDYAGAEITVRLNVPLEVFLEAEKVQRSHDWSGFLDYFVEHVIREWNIDDNTGKPIPVSKEGLAQVPIDFLMAVITAWTEAIAGLNGPLGSPSSNGTPLVEASLPMVSG